MRVGRAVVTVPDQDAAIGWYGRGLGFGVLFDEEIFPGFRAVHVGPGSVAEAGVWLMPGGTALSPGDVPSGGEAPGGEAASGGGASGRAADADPPRAHADQSAGEPLLVLFSDDLDADAERLRAAGTLPDRGPEGAQGARSIHVRDPGGNVIVVVEAPEGLAGPAGT
ncbi:VOC family protein [Brevibacterium album]|uniref:VOC family protein n=1 Tax=Brevibacterium album TaxID=417948 RepID=UPI0004205D56|nr:VOC family protein [Brevibacterium album]